MNVPDAVVVVTTESSTVDIHRFPVPAVRWVPEAQREPRTLQFSLSFFANDEDGLTGPKYQLLLDAARLADRRGLTAIWSPERHFHSFGGLYPSPTATSAALAAATERIGIRAGSVVLPLHDPIRVAEEWSVIDNISGGRVGVSFASGWHANDFVLAPDQYADRRRVMTERVDTVRRLWRGETVRRRNGASDLVDVTIRPRPVQSELPFWFTAAGSPDTFRNAGAAGAFVLTNLMGQTLEELAEKVEIYREAWKAAGHDASGGHLTLMLHAFLGDDERAVRAEIREPLLQYFRSSVDITRGFAASQGLDIDPDDLSAADLDALLEFGLERYLSDSGLFGTVDSCAAMVERVRAVGVDEVAALVDFGVPLAATLHSVELLAELGVREKSHAQTVEAGVVAGIEAKVRELADWIERHPVSAIEAGPDALAWLAEFAPEVVKGVRLLTDDSRPEILRQITEIGGQPLIKVDIDGAISLRARYGPGGELTLDPPPQTCVVDAAGRKVGVGIAGRLALPETGATDQPARWRPDGDIDLLPRPPRRIAPLSFSQQRLWSLDQLGGGSIAYNNPVALRTRGPLDIAALTAALREVVRRHEVLRTTFPASVDGPVQVIHKSVDLNIPVAMAAPEEVDRLATDHARLPFDLGDGPLLRASVLQLSTVDHVLLISMHHIVSDGWSAGILFTELAALYDAYTAGSPSPLPPLPAQFADYARWQRKRADLGPQLDYWREKLAGAPLLELPLDHPRGAVQSHEGARHPVLIDRALADGVRALCARAGVTPFMLLQTTLATLFHRYSGQTDLVIGTTVAGRTQVDFEALVGVFVNALAVRTDASGDPTFRELLGRVKSASLGAFAHQDVPFERVVDELKVARDLSLTPIFQAMLLLHNTPNPRVELGGLTLEALETDPGVAKLDLMLELREGADGIAGAWEYNTALFDRATIAQLTTHFLAILGEAVRHPDRPLSALELLSQQETEDLVALSRGESMAMPAYETVDAAFQAQAARTPDTLALGDDLTYAELDRLSNRIAHGLRAAGVRPGVRVALLLDEPAEAITAMIGVLKAGGTYVPLDPHAPQARREALLAQADTTVIVSNLDDFSGPESPVERLSGGDDPAYVIFTSGSTGHPKGVVVSHSQLLYSTWARLDYYGAPAGKCVAPYPVTFDASVGWIYYTLLTGGTLWAPKSFDPRGVARLVERVRADRFSAIPALYQQLLEAAEAGQLTSLQTVSVIGERCSPEVARLHFDQLAEVGFHNEYGPTEATVWCTSQPVTPPITGDIPIGRPIPRSIALVVDRHGKLAPVGAPGELYVGGPGVAIGYLHQPELTAERFVDDHITGSGRLYRTGDLARWNRDGGLEFLGRVDRQVKIRGFRVEPAEVEAALASHPDVAAAAVVASEGRLIGYVVAKDDLDLRAYLRSRLPDYLVPAQVLAVPELPRNRHGKVDIAALPSASPAVRERFAAPRDDTEAQLAAIFRDVLRGVEVGVHDDFFELGGDSLVAITVVTRARNEGIEINAQQLFQNPTVAGLAAVVGTATTVVAEQGVLTGDVPLGPSQHRYLGWELPDIHQWNGGFQLEFTKPIDVDTLERAFQTVLRHHDSLRLRFVRENGAWRQHYASADELWTLECIETSEDGLEEAASRLQASLELSDGPLIRAAIVHLGQSRPKRLLVGAHHLVIDVLSWHILLTDLFAAYQGKELPAKTTSYREWTTRQAEFVDSVDGRAELKYWAGLPYHRTARIPRDGDGPNVEAATATIRTHLDPAETREILRGDTQAALVTAIATQVAGWTGSPYVHLDLQRHGRNDVVPGLDLSRTTGWFTLPHPVVVRVPAEPSDIADHLKHIPHDGAGYAALRYLLPDSPLSAHGPADIGLNYHGQLNAALPADAPARILDASPGRLRSPQQRRPYLIRVTAAVHDEKLWLGWSYAEGIHHRTTVEDIAQATIRTLRKLIRP